MKKSHLVVNIELRMVAGAVLTSMASGQYYADKIGSGTGTYVDNLVACGRGLAPPQPVRTAEPDRKIRSTRANTGKMATDLPDGTARREAGRPRCGIGSLKADAAWCVVGSTLRRPGGGSGLP